MSKVHGCAWRHVRRVKGAAFAVLCTSLAILLSFLMLGCVSSAPVARSEPFVGTWVHDMTLARWKYQHTSDGKMFVYSKSDPTRPYMESRYKIDRKWRDAKGDYFYDVRALWSGIPYDKQYATTWYVTVRIDPSGNKLEEIANQSGYVDTSNAKLLWMTYRRVK